MFITAKFTTLRERSVLKLPENCGEAVVAKIVSNTELHIVAPVTHDIGRALLQLTDKTGTVVGTSYRTIPYLDRAGMYSGVADRLMSGGAVGVFPEGGSHDRTEMLPMAPGAALMAFETLVKSPNTKVRIVPCGLYYFHSDKVSLTSNSA